MGKILNKVFDNFYFIEIEVYVKVKLVIKTTEARKENSNRKEIIKYLKIYLYCVHFQV